MQTLWAGPWLVKVVAYTPDQAGQGLFAMNAGILVAYGLWGWANPWLLRIGYGADRLIQKSMSLSQPAVALAMRPELAGRALSAFNLVVFAGVFVVQWGMGLGIDALLAYGVSQPHAYQISLGMYAVCNAGAYGYFCRFNVK